MRASALIASLLLVACSGPPDAPTTSPEPPPASMPEFFASCDELNAGIEEFGGDAVFRHHVEGILAEDGITMDEADEAESASALLAIRDVWLRCGLKVPPEAREAVKSAERLLGQGD